EDAVELLRRYRRSASFRGHRLSPGDQLVAGVSGAAMQGTGSRGPLLPPPAGTCRGDDVRAAPETPPRYNAHPSLVDGRRRHEAHQSRTPAVGDDRSGDRG